MKSRYLLSLLACLLLTGCYVHEWPVNGGPDGAVVDVTLNLKFDKTLPQYQDVTFQSKAGGTTFTRYVVGFYRYASEQPESKPDYLFSFTENEMTDRSFTVEVPPLNYRVLVWADYVPAAGPYYTSPAFEEHPSEQNFSEVTLADGPYSGSDPLREAFYGAQDVKLASYLSHRAQHSQDIPMVRPQARFNFLATDKLQFISYWAQEKDYDFSDILVQISYPQFLPSTFNLMQERPVDSRSGVAFTSKAAMLEDGTVDLASDWVFAYADQTSVLVNLSFYDARGQYVCSLNNITVPLCQGKNTTIKGALLTNGIESGILIDPGFEGIIEVPL